MNNSQITASWLMAITTVSLGVMIILSFVKEKNESISPRSYQIDIIDDSLRVYDADRVVGTVKIQGQLDSLIIDDNQ